MCFNCISDEPEYTKIINNNSTNIINNIVHKKVVIVGNSGVGKSSLLRRLCDNTFDCYEPTSMGIDYRKTGNNKIQFNIFDIAGQPRFRQIGRNYMKNADMFILVFDTTDTNSLLGLREWYEECKLCSNDINTSFILVGTKNDLSKKYFINHNIGHVSHTDIDIFCQFYNTKYYDTSSKNGDGIDKLFSFIMNELK
jgi:small GTP-binding protein